MGNSLFRTVKERVSLGNSLGNSLRNGLSMGLLKGFEWFFCGFVYEEWWNIDVDLRKWGCNKWTSDDNWNINSCLGVSGTGALVMDTGRIVILMGIYRRYGETWWNMVKHGETWWNMVKQGETWWNMVKHGETRWNKVKHGEAWWNIVKHGETWWNMVKHGEPWWNMVKHTGLFSLRFI